MRPPSVNKLALSITNVDLPQPLLVAAAREAIAAGDPTAAADIARQILRTLLGPAINATGVLLHTNLGRSPLAPFQTEQNHTRHNQTQPDHTRHNQTTPDQTDTHNQTQPDQTDTHTPGAPARATNLEFDLATGRRGSRHVHTSRLLTQLTGAQAALVVNNCAAAVMLVLAALARGRGVAVSRGELVEIGGGFRVPDVMAQSGAHLVEVGTTNRTRAQDYAHAVDADLALLLKVHPSNYRISGFTEQTTVAELAQIGPPVVVDLGSGLLDERCDWIGVRPDWLRDEPGVRQTLEAGAAVVTFSGDKLFGGPQAGIICGHKELVDACATHPLMRALRPGGLVLAALQQTALAYLRRDGTAIPFWAMASQPLDELVRRSHKLAAAAGTGRPVLTEALAGAGSLPDQAIPSAGLELAGDLTAELREAVPPVIARVKNNATVLDLRTVDAADDARVAAAIRSATSRGTTASSGATASRGTSAAST